MTEKDFSKLKKERQSMPGFVREALNNEKLMEAYQSRPPYQQNDYLGWINRAKKEETKIRRMKQMLEELEQGNVYMKMKCNPK